MAHQRVGSTQSCNEGKSDACLFGTYPPCQDWKHQHSIQGKFDNAEIVSQMRNYVHINSDSMDQTQREVVSEEGSDVEVRTSHHVQSLCSTCGLESSLAALPYRQLCPPPVRSLSLYADSVHCRATQQSCRSNLFDIASQSCCVPSF